jgi:hypothetical protein
VSEKQIILQPNQPPQFVGPWTVGEIMQMAQGLIRWLESLTVTNAKPDEEKHE